MPRHPILSARPGSQQPNDPYAAQGIRHDIVFPGFGPTQELAGRPSLEREVLETEVRLDYLLEEKRNLERKRQELQALNEKQSQFRERRDQIVDEVLRTLEELQKSGHFEIRRADAYDRSGANARRLRMNLETLQRLELKDPVEYPKLAEGIRRLREAELDLEAELNRLETLEDSTPVNPLFEGLVPERRSLLEWARLGLTFFLPVIVIGMGAVLLVIAFVGK
jgi:hypothetical protein